MPASSLSVSLAPRPQGATFLEIEKSHKLIAAFLDKSISRPFSPVYPVFAKNIFSSGEICSKILYSHPKLGICVIDESSHSSNKSNEFLPFSLEIF